MKSEVKNLVAGDTLHEALQTLAHGGPVENVLDQHAVHAHRVQVDDVARLVVVEGHLGQLGARVLGDLLEVAKLASRVDLDRREERGEAEQIEQAQRLLRVAGPRGSRARTLV